MFRRRTSSARAAVSYSSRHSVRSRRSMSRRSHSRSRLASGMLRVWSCFSARRCSSTSPSIARIRGARAVARERSDGRDVAVPRRRRRVMPALRDDAGQAGAGDRRVAELVLDDRRVSGGTSRASSAPDRAATRTRRRRARAPLPHARDRRRWANRVGCAAVAIEAVVPACAAGRQRPSAATSQETCRLRARATWRAAATGPVPPRDPTGSAGRARGEWALPRGADGLESADTGATKPARDHSM